MHSLEALFCVVDNFCQVFEPLWTQQLLSDGTKRRQRQPRLSLSERMTILIAFHQSHYRNCKAYFYKRLLNTGQQHFPICWVCRVDTFNTDSVECLSAQLLWPMHRSIHYGCNQDCRMS